VPIRVICRCKGLIVLPDTYTGRHVQCPDCGAMLRIPTEQEDRELTRWNCSCGQHLKARARTAGQAVICPRCKAEIAVPLPEEYESFIEEKFTEDVAGGVLQLAPPGSVEEPSLSAERAEVGETELTRAPTEEESDVTTLDPCPADRDTGSAPAGRLPDTASPAAGSGPQAGDPPRPDRAEDESGSDIRSLEVPVS